MKKIFVLAVILITVWVNAFSQKKGEENKTEPWFDVFDRTPFQQGKDGVLLIEIKNTGKDVNDCIEKAKQQAVYAVIFSGYTEANNIPGSPALSPTDAALYNEKLEFFKEFFNNTSLYRSFVPEAKINPAKPVSKIDRKTVEAFIIVTIEVNRLRNSLEQQNIIKSIIDFGFKPSVLIVPSDEFMSKNGYVTKKNNQGITEEIYDYPNAVKDEKISKALSAVANKFGGPKGAFVIADMKAQLDNIKLQESKNNARPDAKKESAMDIFARVLAADLWIKADLTEIPLENGLTTQYLITLSANDPYTNTLAIPGKTIEKTTRGDNKFQLMTNAMNGAADDFRPLVLAFFKDRVEKGLMGSAMVSTSEDIDFNLDTKFAFKGKEYPLKQIVDSYFKKSSITFEPTGTQTSTTRNYSVRIPLEYKDELTESNSKNSFENFGAQIGASMEALGLTYKTETEGLGKVDVIITGKK